MPRWMYVYLAKNIASWFPAKARAMPAEIFAGFTGRCNRLSKSIVLCELSCNNREHMQSDLQACKYAKRSAYTKHGGPHWLLVQGNRVYVRVRELVRIKMNTDCSPVIIKVHWFVHPSELGARTRVLELLERQYVIRHNIQTLQYPIDSRRKICFCTKCGNLPKIDGFGYLDKCASQSLLSICL